MATIKIRPTASRLCTIFRRMCKALNSDLLPSDVGGFRLFGRFFRLLFLFVFLEALLELAHSAAEPAHHLRDPARAEEEDDDKEDDHPGGGIASAKSKHIKHSMYLLSSTRRRLRPRAPRRSRR